MNRPEHPTGPWNTFQCLLCEAQPLFDAPPPANNCGALLDHCHEAHPEIMDGDQVAGERAPGAHYDGDTWYAWVYRWTLPDGRPFALQSTGNVRRMDDPMRWAG